MKEHSSIGPFENAVRIQTDCVSVVIYLRRQCSNLFKKFSSGLRQFLPLAFFLFQGFDGMEQILNGVRGVAVCSTATPAEFFVVVLPDRGNLIGIENH